LLLLLKQIRKMHIKLQQNNNGNATAKRSWENYFSAFSPS